MTYNTWIHQMNCFEPYSISHLLAVFGVQHIHQFRSLEFVTRVDGQQHINDSIINTFEPSLYRNESKWSIATTDNCVSDQRTKINFSCVSKQILSVLCSVHLSLQFLTHTNTNTRTPKLNKNIWKLFVSNGIHRDLMESIWIFLLASFLWHQALKCLFKHYKCVTFIENRGLLEN